MEKVWTERIHFKVNSRCFKSFHITEFGGGPGGEGFIPVYSVNCCSKWPWCSYLKRVISVDCLRWDGMGRVHFNGEDIWQIGQSNLDYPVFEPWSRLRKRKKNKLFHNIEKGPFCPVCKCICLIWSSEERSRSGSWWIGPRAKDNRGMKYRLQRNPVTFSCFNPNYTLPVN